LYSIKILPYFYQPSLQKTSLERERYKSGGKTSVPIPGPDDQELQNRAFKQICLYGYFVAELPEGDQGVFMRGGGLGRNLYEQYGPGDEYGDDGGYEPVAGYGEQEQFGYDQYEGQHGAYKRNAYGQGENEEGMPDHSGLMNPHPAIIPHSGMPQHGGQQYEQHQQGEHYGSSQHFGGQY
jgi:hypothetical protein